MLSMTIRILEERIVDKLTSTLTEMFVILWFDRFSTSAFGICISSRKNVSSCQAKFHQGEYQLLLHYPTATNLTKYISFSCTVTIDFNNRFMGDMNSGGARPNSMWA